MRRSLKNLLLVMICGWLFALTLPASAAELAPAIKQRLEKSAALLISPNGAACGTAHLIDREARLMLTNYHTVEDFDNYVVVFQADRPQDAIYTRAYYMNNWHWQKIGVTARVIHRDPGRDLALLQISQVPASAQALPLAQEMPRVGQPIYRVGGFFSKDGQMTDQVFGLVSAKITSYFTTNWQWPSQRVNTPSVKSDAKGIKGNSGSGVVNDQGELIGVHSSGEDAPPHSNATVLAEVKQFLAQAKGELLHTETGKWQAGSATDRVRKGSYSRVHSISMKPGASYQIDLESFGKSIDTFLRIEDSTGQELAFDDDGGDRQQARLFFWPTREETYRVIATTFEPKTTGQYKLNVRRTPLQNVKNLKGSGPAKEQVYSYNGQMTSTTSFDPARPGKRALYHWVRLVAGNPYQIDMTSTAFDTFLRLEDNDGREVLSDDDGGGNLNARITWTPRRSGQYRIVTTMYTTDKFGDYQLTVRSPKDGPHASVRNPRLLDEPRLFRSWIAAEF